MYRQVFEKITSEDKPFMDEDEDMEIPQFGASDSSYEEVLILLIILYCINTTILEKFLKAKMVDFIFLSVISAILSKICTEN